MGLSISLVLGFETVRWECGQIVPARTMLTLSCDRCGERESFTHADATKRNRH